MDSQEKSWDSLKKWSDIEPSPTYLSSFYSRLASETPWHKKVWKIIREFLKIKVLAPVLVSFGLLILAGFFMEKNHAPEITLANLSEDDAQMLKNFDLTENYDVIKEIDFLENLEVIESLDLPQSFINNERGRVIG